MLNWNIFLMSLLIMWFFCWLQKLKLFISRKGFMFDQRWVSCEGVQNVVGQSWKVSVHGSKFFQLTQKVKNCWVALLDWDRKTNFNSQNKIHNLKKDMQRLKFSNVFSGDTIRELKRQLGDSYKDEELYWKQKSKV
ncbi:hypothetical protein ACH5RR_002839 [Cinchona calisaya]|uniref:Uncharacterized protein n=1 Tax=Cinchona calisaya TaxID=153742 RepID=A0ABD3ATF5_9GENT